MTTNTSCIRCKWKENPDNARYEGMACSNPTVLERYNADTGRTLSRMYIDQARLMFCRGGLFEETELAKAAAVALSAGETTAPEQDEREALQRLLDEVSDVRNVDDVAFGWHEAIENHGATRHAQTATPAAQDAAEERNTRIAGLERAIRESGWTSSEILAAYLDSHGYRLKATNPLTATIPVAQLLDIRHALVKGAHLDRLFLLAELLEKAIERATGKPFAEVQG